ncbi:MAG: fructose-1,6-bisphosphatase [Ignavibacteriaceae bacterium]|nr:fructose-1,6-bisphosphatase [Ignavibacteriaceae bacterium]
MPKKSQIYSVNEGNYLHWEDGLKKYIDYLKEEDKETGRPYSLRYVGSMVADIHRTLLYRGIFMYPADNRYPNGKLRVMYECNPMSMLVEAAGGKATNGKQRILEVHPSKLHERSPIYIGNEHEINTLRKFIDAEKVDDKIIIDC